MFNLFTVAHKCRIGEFMTKKIISHRVEKRISTILLIRQELCRYSFTKNRKRKKSIEKKLGGSRADVRGHNGRRAASPSGLRETSRHQVRTYTDRKRDCTGPNYICFQILTYENDYVLCTRTRTLR